MALSASRLQMLLAQSPVFQGRVEIIMLTVAGGIFAEQGQAGAHAARVAYAQRVMNAPAQMAQAAAPLIAQSPNVANTVDIFDDGVRTTVEDAALFAQISALWNALAGYDSGS